MKTIKIISSTLILGVAFLFGSCSESFIDVPVGTATSLKDAALHLNDDGSLAGTVSGDEITGLLFVAEEEKMARDVYNYLYDLYQARVFSNIAASEQTHMDQVLDLIEGYGIENTGITEPGVFNNSDIAGLYQTLIEWGDDNIESAYQVGAYIEEFDIHDLSEWMNVVSNENIDLVYSNLLSGSENHLRSFVRNLSNVGVTYEPEILDASYYDEILSGTTGNGRGRMGRF